ncbi:MAG: amino acid permease [Armatimonadetes bacterium]|nr:amino acid permease [Armatimonadota bacterium]
MPPDSNGDRLPRRIGLWTAVAIVVGSTIGSGIFRSPAAIAESVPGPMPMLGVWIAGGLLVLCGALTLAEVGSALPKTGGIYVFVREGWGKLPAFLFGWAQLSLLRAAALGAVATTFAEYALGAFRDDPPRLAVSLLAATGIAIVAAANYLGVRWGSLVQNITTVAKVTGLLLIVTLAFALGLPETGGHYTPAIPPGSLSVTAFAAALVSVLWAFDGWSDASYVAGEIIEPKKNVPRAIIFGTLIIIVVYILVNLAYLAVLPVEQIAGSKLVAADVAELLIGGPGVALVAITVMISTFGTLNGTMLTSPRVFFAMADEGMLFPWIASVNPRFKTPSVAIGLTAVVSIAMVMIGTFEQLADAFVTGVTPFYVLAVAAIFVLRRRPDYHPSYRVPLYPVIPTIFILGSIFFLGNAVLDPASRWPTLSVFGLILLGIPVYYATVGRKKRSPRADS